MKCLSTIPAFIFLFLLANSCVAQKDMIDIKNVLNSAVSWNFIRGITQDLKGNMWFATLNGLVQYNGVNYTVYTNNPSSPASLPNNTIQAICADANGNIWAGSHSGLSRFDPATRAFTNYLHIPGDSSSLGDSPVIALTEDHEGYI